MRLGIEHDSFVLNGDGRVTRIIDAGDHHLHVVTTFAQRISRHRHFIAQVTVFIDGDRAVKLFAVDADHHTIAHLRVTGNLAANQCRHAGFGGIHGVVTGHSVDGQGVMRLSVEHHGFVFHRNRGVTRIIDAGDHHLHVVAAFVQGVGRYRHFIAQVTVVIGCDFTIELFAVNAHHHVIAHLRVARDFAANQCRHTGFGSVHGVVTGHGVDGQGIVRLGVEHHGFVLNGDGRVTRIINARHHHLHVVTAFAQRISRHRHLIAQVAVFIDGHRAVKLFTVDADHHMIAHLRVAGDLTADKSRHAGFGSVDHVVSRHGVDGQGIVRLSVEDHGFVFHRNRGITGIINTGDHHLHVVTTFTQRIGRHRHFVAQMTVFIDGDRAVKFFAVNTDHDFIAHLRVAGHLTADQGWHAGFGGIHGVITGHLINSQGVVRLSVEHHGFVFHRNRGITGIIDAGDHHLHVVTAFAQRVCWHRHLIAQVAVFIDGDFPVERLAVDADHHAVTRLRITRDCTADQSWHA
ncbi:hypothetical protein BSPA111_14730 [Buttiauxella sp. A111]|nr:hypothetical protein BSPA111_14730 [Buttiauxella sp. A111]